MENETIVNFSVDVFYDQLVLDKNQKIKKTMKNFDYIIKINDLINDVFSSNQIKVTWFVSNVSEIIKKFQENFLSLNRNTNEIGMHNLVSIDLDIEKSKEDMLQNYIKKSLQLFNNYEIFPTSTRIAGCTSSDLLMKVLSENKIKVDSSAIPKRIRKNKIKFDWSTTSSEPYFPSKKDYRITENEKTNCHKILEVPLTTIPTKTYSEKFPVNRYLDFFYKPKIIKNSLETIINKNKHIIIIMHPMMLLYETPLYTTKLSDVKTNFEELNNVCSKNNRKLTIQTFSEIFNSYQTNNQ